MNYPREGWNIFSRTLNIYMYIYVHSAFYRVKFCYTAYENARKCSISVEKNQNFLGRDTPFSHSPPLDASNILSPEIKSYLRACSVRYWAMGMSYTIRQIYNAPVAL